MKVFIEIDENVYSKDEFEMVKKSVLIGDGTLKLISENVTDEDDFLPQVIGTITGVTNVKLDE